jgi:hypothetical protein
MTETNDPHWKSAHVLVHSTVQSAQPGLVHRAVVEQVSHRQSQGLQSLPLGAFGVLGAIGTDAAPPEQASWSNNPRSEQIPPPQPTGPKAERTTTVPTTANATATDLIVGLPRPSAHYAHQRSSQFSCCLIIIGGALASPRCRRSPLPSARRPFPICSPSGSCAARS